MICQMKNFGKVKKMWGMLLTVFYIILVVVVYYDIVVKGLGFVLMMFIGFMMVLVLR